MASPNVITRMTCIVMVLISSATTLNTAVRMEFPEEQERGTIVADLAKIFNVRSPDIGGRSFDILSQRMKSGHKVIANDGNWVEINKETGVITVKEPVDRETECGEDSELECVIVLKTAMMPQAHFRMQNVELIVTDINDHNPKFPASDGEHTFSIDIREDAPLIVINLDKYLATDEDTGDNARISYSMPKNKYFKLQQQTDSTGAPHLGLEVKSALDYESMDMINFTITAEDKGSPIHRSRSVKFSVRVLDANDNHPIFEEEEYNLNLRENLPAGKVITSVLAHDADRGQNGQVRYFIPKAGNSVTARRLIEVDANTGVVRLRQPLDRETHDNLRIVIGARDKSAEEEGGRKAGKTYLMIHVADMNDNEPRIQIDIILKGENKEAAYIRENADRGTYVAFVSATDADTGMNGIVSLKIDTKLMTATDDIAGDRPVADVNNHFILNSDNLIATNVILDREQYNKYSITITACDNGNPPRCSIESVPVILLDVNDNAPIFTSGQENSIILAEDRQVGTYIAAITASDADHLNAPALVKTDDGTFEHSEYGEVRYSLSYGGAVFAIESKTGKLTLVGKLDYEAKKDWKLIVTAQDMGVPPKKTNFTYSVHVTDVNDHKPEFSRPAVDNSTIYATILDVRPFYMIKSLDRDQGDNSRVWYSISCEDGEMKPHKFNLDPVTGSLRLNSSNKLKELLGKHSLTIKASDSGNPPLEAETTLYIEVTDLPLSSLIPTDDNDLSTSSTSMTVIVLAALASATIILLLILACIVVKCKRENKEIRTYNCRAAESKSGRPTLVNPSKSSMSQVGSVDEVVVVSTPGQVTSTRDVYFSKAINEMNQTRSLTLGNNRPLFDPKAKYSSFDRGNKFSTFSMANQGETNGTTNIVSSNHNDGDSGRGESDKDCDSFSGDRENQANNEKLYSMNISSTQTCKGYLNELGPRCTINCRDMGHSDTCWMPVIAHCDIHGDQDSFVYSDGGSENGSETAYVNRNYSQHFIPSLNPQPTRFFDSCSLETISETQPLRLILESGGNSNKPVVYSSESYNINEYPSYPGSNSLVDYQNDNQDPYLHTYATVGHYPEQSQWQEMCRSPEYETSSTFLLNQPPRPSSVRSYYRDGSFEQPPRPPSQRSNRSDVVSPHLVSHNNPYLATVSTSGLFHTRPLSGDLSDDERKLENRDGNVMEKVKHFSQVPQRRPSLRDQVLQRRFIAQNVTDSKNENEAHVEDALMRDDLCRTDNFPTKDGSVSLEETQRIISDIDKLITS